MLVRAAGKRPAKSVTPLAEIFHLGAVFWRLIERRAGDFFIGNRNAEPRAKLVQLLFVQLLVVVRDVAALARFAQAVSLDRLGQNDRRLALVFDRDVEGRENFLGIVPAAAELLQLFVGVVFDEL